MTARQPDGPAARRFARLDAALTALSELAAGPAAGRLPELLAGDDLALALMRAAADVVREAGMPVDLDAGHGDDDLLGRAAGWQAYAGGPVSELHGACGRAIARGLLRVWARRQGIRTGGAAARRAGLRQARVRLLGRIRTRCAALRAELRDTAAALPQRRGAAFEDHVGRRVDEVARELCQAAQWELGWEFGDPGALCGAVGIHLDPPAAGSARLEDRLTMLLGAGFGTGAALTAARVAGDALPASGPVAAAVAAIAGTALGGALVRTRRLLVRRAVLDRWVIEVTAQLRAELEEHVAVLALAAQAAGAAEASRVGSSTGPGSAGSPIGDTGDYRPASRRR